MKQIDQFSSRLRFDNSGRHSVFARMQLIHNDAVLVIKAKHCIGQTATTLIGRVLTTQSLRSLFGLGIYEDWGNEPNGLRSCTMAVLTAVEINQASCYLVFQPAE